MIGKHFIPTISIRFKIVISRNQMLHKSAITEDMPLADIINAVPLCMPMMIQGATIAYAAQ